MQTGSCMNRVATKCGPIWDQQSFYSTDQQWDEVEGKFWRNLQILEPLPLLQRVNTRGGLIMQSVCIIGTSWIYAIFSKHQYQKNFLFHLHLLFLLYMVRLRYNACFFYRYLNSGGVQLSSPINIQWWCNPDSRDKLYVQSMIAKDNITRSQNIVNNRVGQSVESALIAHAAIFFGS